MRKQIKKEIKFCHSCEDQIEEAKYKYSHFDMLAQDEKTAEVSLFVCQFDKH